MDSARGSDGSDNGGIRQDNDPTDAGVGEAQVTIGSDERRMHVRAYNHWVSLLGGRPFPTIADLDPARIADFGPHSVLLDFSDGLENPAIQFLGAALRAECGVSHSITSIAQVPPRSLLSRLTDHYLQIIANRAPVGFEAEFVGIRGHNTFYRGILMPFSSSGETIDYIYGVINWKEMVGSDTQAGLNAELARSVRSASRAGELSSVWADGPSAAPALATSADAELTELLDLARESAAGGRTARSRHDAAFRRALGRAHEFACAAQREPLAYASLLDAAGLDAREPASTEHVAHLVFGGDDAAVARAAAVLAYARRRDIPDGGLARAIDALPDGVAGMVADERARRRKRAARGNTMPLADRAVLGTVPPLGPRIAARPGDAVVLLGRVAKDGRLDVVGVSDDRRLADRVLARLR